MDMREYINIPFKLSGANTITQKKSGDTLTLFGADADIFTLGDSTHEGGDIKVYRDGSNNLQLSLDTDAASNALALSVYGGVLAQNYLTVGQAALNTTFALYVSGQGYFTSATTCNALTVMGGNIVTYNNNNCTINTPVTDANDHYARFRINSTDIIVAQATGDGSGGITNKAVGLYGITPTTQAAHIADPAENVAANNAAIDAILVALENIGITASA